MPNLQNAKKALRQSKKRAQRNKVAKATIHSMRVQLRKMVEVKNIVEAEKLARLVGQKLDKAAHSKLLKKNTAARYKSRLMKKVNALKNT